MANVAFHLVSALALVASAELSAEGVSPIQFNSDRIADSLLKTGFKEEYLASPDSLLKPTREEESKGFVLYVRDRNFEILPNSRPRREEADLPLHVSATPGEFEPFCFSIYALKDLEGVTFSVGPLSSVSITSYDVEYVPTRYRSSWDDEDRKNYFLRYPLYLVSPVPRRVPRGTSRQYWVDLRISEDQKPGEYKAQVTVTAQNGGRRRLPVILTVFPFKLVNDGSPRFGAFLAGTRSLTAPLCRDLKAHGLDAAQWFWKHGGMNLENEGGKLKINFAHLDSAIGNLQSAGLRGPVVLGLGNDNVAHYERKLCQVFNLPLELPPVERNGEVVRLVHFEDTRLQALYLDGLTQLRDHARASRYPEVSLIIFDESAERLAHEQEDRYRLIKKHLPEFPIYGVFMMKGEVQEAQADFCDIIVANSRLERFRDLAREKKKRFWMYTFLGAKSSFGKVRVSYGLYPVHYGAEAMFFWCLDYYNGNPWNEMDGDISDGEWVIAYPPVSEGGPLSPTPAWLAMREAVDDARYLATLKSKTGALPDSLSALLKSIVEGTSYRGAGLGDSAFFAGAEKGAPDRLRSAAIRALINK